MTKDTDYAVRALIHLAQNPGRYISSRDIAQKERIPLQFLRILLQKLIRHGLLTAKEGVTGGVQLRKSPAGIYLLELIKIFQGNVQITHCVFKKKICSSRSTCVLRSRMKSIEGKLIEEFKGISIEMLSKDT